MENKRLSAVEVNLREFRSTCKFAPPKDDVSTSVLLRKGPLSVNSVSNITTLEYLENFRKRTGYQPKDQTPEVREIQSNAQKEVTCDEGENEVVELPKDDDEICKELEENVFVNHRLTAEQLLVLDEFWSLKTVDISDNELKNVRNLGAMPYLQTINASKNQLETFLEITPPLPASLKEVDFSYNKIAIIVELIEYWSLTHINLSHNELTKVEGFSGLNYLQVLDLSHNKIETIIEIDCPSLISLHLNSNKLGSITEYIGCQNLRYLNLHKNKLSTVTGLKHLTELTELNISENEIDDIAELECLQPLLNLTRVKIHPNPISSMENWRLVLVHGLCQILWLDETFVEPSELRAAANLFSPSYKKLAYLDYSEILVHQACQSANTIFDGYCRNRPSPPILLIVGPPRSGVHSTATTIEGSHPKLDIPVSYESFQEMKNNGEFLATCQILGRICGFATSQIARAAEKMALLVAVVPLNTAIALREWNLNPKLVLALPSTPPEFPLDEERIESIRRSIGSDPGEGLLKRKSSEGNKSETGASTDEEKDHHLVNFAEMLSVVPSAAEEKDPEKILYEEEEDEHDLEVSSSEPIQHSILKSPRFEVNATSSNDNAADLDDFMVDDDQLQQDEEDIEELEAYERSLELFEARTSKDASRVRISNRLSEHLEQDTILDMEKKKRGRLKSLAPGMERYSVYDQDAIANADDDDDDDLYDDATEAEFPDEWADNEEMELLNSKVADINIMGSSNSGAEQDTNLVHKTTPHSANAENVETNHLHPRSSDSGSLTEGSVPAALIYGSKRINRLASLLILQPDQSAIPSLKIPDILMNLSSPENLDPKWLQPTFKHPTDQEFLDDGSQLFDDFFEEEDEDEEESEDQEEHDFQAVPIVPDQSVQETNKPPQVPPKMENLTGGLCTPFQWPGLDPDSGLESPEGRLDSGVEAGNQEEHGNENGLLKSMPTTQQVHNANVVSIPTDETGVPGVISVSNTQAPEELLPSNPLSSRKSTSANNLDQEPKSGKKQKKKGLRFHDSTENVNTSSPEEFESAEENKAAGSDNGLVDDPFSTNVESTDGERQHQPGQQHRNSTDEKIKEPVHLALSESEHSEQHTEQQQQHHHHLTHKEAMTFSILQTKERYSKFHSENPGFFHTVIDTADLCESYQVLENVVMDALIKFRQESIVYASRSPVVKSHAGANKVDAKYFLVDRLQKMKDSSVLWTRGCEIKNRPSEQEVQTFQQLYSSQMEQSEVLFTRPTCSRNLLDPTIHRPPITFKMRKLVELQEKRVKCSMLQKTSNDCQDRCK
ncbi:Leucine-rich repeat and guanylate kinase domain-containing protein [Folsomia candida]|uniref:Leucine-rich repeat and guanylate kinase domain-containing protein n=1 Tax=Folsomia candida TaxID=158441 RepID=A0A226F0P7_FOLCA|nr:Leucine-rich repeat and guanylate kinase domain-containing protein [Folsomia candida]